MTHKKALLAVKTQAIRKEIAKAEQELAKLQAELKRLEALRDAEGGS